MFGFGEERTWRQDITWIKELTQSFDFVARKIKKSHVPVTRNAALLRTFHKNDGFSECF